MAQTQNHVYQEPEQGPANAFRCGSSLRPTARHCRTSRLRNLSDRMQRLGRLLLRGCRLYVRNGDRRPRHPRRNRIMQLQPGGMHGILRASWLCTNSMN